MSHDLRRFLQPKEPWWFSMCRTLPEITDFSWSLALNLPEQLLVRVLRGQKMSTPAGLFDEFAAALQFPYYFGENWNAFDECINDLEWLRSSAYLLIIVNADQLL